MAYQKQSFTDGVTVLQADHLKHIEDGIVANESAIGKKQDTLVSGQNIKTINGQSILGTGDIVIQGGTGGDSGGEPSEPENPLVMQYDQTKNINFEQEPFTCDIKAGDKVTFRISEIEISSDLSQNLAIYTFQAQCGYLFAFNYDANAKKWTHGNPDISSATQVEGTEFTWTATADITSANLSISYANPSADKGKVTCRIQIFTGEEQQTTPSGQEETIGTYFAEDGNGNIGLADSVATIESSVVTQDMRIQQIKFWSLQDGTVRFGIGYLDQRNWALMDKTFDKPVTKGANTIDVSSENIVIPSGRRLFVYNDANESGKQLIAWKANTSESEKAHEMLYGTVDGTVRPVSRMDTEYGATMSLQYTVVAAGSEFATVKQLNELTDTVEAQDRKIARIEKDMNIVKDSAGTSYRMKVVDGAISLEAIGYNNVLVVSHSWGLHPAAYNYGFCCERGMASSVDGNDFVSMLRTAMQSVRPSAKLNVVNVAVWEQNAGNITVADEYLSADIDLVIIRVGENRSNGDGYENDLIEFINHMKGIATKADFVVCTTGLNAGMAIQTENAGTATGCKIASASWTDSDNWNTPGDYIEGWGTDNQGSTWNKEETVLYQITNPAVCNHPSDYGMLTVANSILNAISYDELDIAYNITFNSSVGGSCPKKRVKGGIVTVHADSSAKVTANTSENAVEVTSHGNGCFTFKMPAADVTVTVS